MEENKDGAEKKWRMVFEEMVETEDLQFLTGNRQTNWQFLILQLVRAERMKTGLAPNRGWLTRLARSDAFYIDENTPLTFKH